ncbi:MAG TPA: hypothetical protein ENI87_11900 [bacterium]|nr:hypothetical protein [bacterium]
MVGILIKAVIGLVLFVGSLIGGLAATGRLNHEGTANIPILSGFFPEPEETGGEDGEPGTGEHEDGGHGAEGESEAHAVDASHAAADGHAAQDAAHAGGDPQGHGQEPKKPRRLEVGKSVVNPEEPKAEGGGHGGGGEGGEHGGGDEGGHGEGEDAHGGPSHGKDSGHGKGSGHGQHPAPAGEGKSEVEKDFDRLLKSQGKIGYQPGAYFQFQGMPAGLTPEQLNEAWQRVQGIEATIAKREAALDLRKQQLDELADDINRRMKALADEQSRIQEMQRKLDNKIAEFEQTVRLVRDDEIPKLKEYAASIAALEADKRADIVQQNWATERGQDHILRVLEFMAKDKLNETLDALPVPMVQEILDKRMQISKEAKTRGGRK